MSYLNDPREMAIRPESGVTLEEDNRYEEMWHWGAAVLDLCNLPVEEYMKPMTVIGVGGGGEGGGDESSSATKTYTLNFYLDGTKKTSFKLEEGAPIPEVSGEKEGYDFSGWADASGNTHTSMPASNLSLYGTNTIKKFTVKFIVDGEELSEYEQVINWNAKVTNIPSSAKTGYNFSGWEPQIPSTIKSNYTFEGSFTKKSYVVSFNISGQVQTAEFEYGDTIEYHAADSKEGYTICGWTPYYETMPDLNNVVFKAVLSANEYTVKYVVKEDGLDDQIIAEHVVKFGQSIPAQAIPVQSGYSFTNWASDVQVVGNKMPASDVTFSSVKTANQYTLAYYVDGSQIGETRTYSYGAKVEPMAQYEKEGHTVTPWSYNHALDEIPQELGGGYSMPYYNVVATCTTSINSYPVVIKHNGEVIYSGSVVYGTEISTLVPEGYSYTGATTTVPAEAVELDADINSYNVTVKIDGNDVVLNLEYKSDIESAIENYIEENYPDEMVGHHIETNVPAGATVPAHDVQYTASIVPNQHTITISGASGVIVNYGENILDAIEGKVEIDEFHYLEGWEMNGQPITSADTMPDEDVTVVPIIKVKESSVTPVVSGETAESGTSYDYGTPISEVIEDIIASASPETQADLEDPGYAVEWTVNGSAYTEDMVVKEDEITVEVTITPKPFRLSFMSRGNVAAAIASTVIESGDTLYKEAIEYPELPAEVEVSGVTYEFKWDEGSIEEGTPMPSREVVVYGEYVEKPVVNTVYYGLINYRKLANLTEDSPEVVVLNVSEGMPVSKEFPLIVAYDYSYKPHYDDWMDEEIDDEEFIEILNSSYAMSPVILLPESINKEDYNWKRGVEEVSMTFVKDMTIGGNNYKLWYEPHMGGTAGGYTVEGYYAPNSQGIDATISFENKN